MDTFTEDLGKEDYKNLLLEIMYEHSGSKETQEIIFSHSHHKEYCSNIF